MNKTILVIDDDQINLESITDSLSFEGYEYLLAHNGEEAMLVLEENHERIKTIILDWMMPKMDGMAFLKWIKQDARFQRIPVIMQTARAQDQDIVAGLDEGVFQYLTKPFSEEVLLSMVKKALLEFDSLTKMQKDAQDKIEGIRNYAFSMIERERLQTQFDLDSLQVMNDFFISSLDCEDYRAITELLLNSIKRFRFQSAPGVPDSEPGQLRCSILLKGEEDLDLTDRGIDSKLDRMILQKALESAGNVQSGDYTALSSSHGLVAVMMRNTPKEPAETKMAMQILERMVDQFESRLLHFKDQIELTKKQRQIEKIVESSAKELNQVNQTYQSVKESQMELLEGLEQAFQKEPAGLSEEQREGVLRLFREVMDRSFALYAEDQITDQQFLLAVEQLRGLFESSSDEERLKPGQLGGTSQADIDALLAQFG